MPTLAEIRSSSRWTALIEGQPQHLILLVFLTMGAAWALQDCLTQGGFLGLGSLGWAWVSIWLAIAHQVLVAAVFRLQLHRALFSRLFGDRDMAVWAVLFFPLLVARPLSILVVGWLDTGSLPVWRPASLILGLVLLPPAIWTLYSVNRYFGFARAMGGDHFRDRFGAMPMVRAGAFRWSNNAMYGFAFLGLWSIALLFGSYQALVVAAFQHAYIWVHMYTTERPDMDRLFPAA